MHVHMVDTSIGLLTLSGFPMYSSAPLAGRFGVADTLDVFAGVFKLFTMIGTIHFPQYHRHHA